MAASARSANFFLGASAPEFDAVLALYDQALRLKAESKSSKPDNVVKLDKWYQNELPKKIKSRGKDPHLTHEELVQTIKWKLARGKFRPNLVNLVQMNTPRVAVQETKKGFRNAFKRQDLMAAMTALCNLKGVGPALASAILAAGAPHLAPFMADECLLSMPDCDSTLDYTMKEYMKLVEQVNATVERLNNQGGDYNCHKVELAVWTYYVLNDLKPELLEEIKEKAAAAPAATETAAAPAAAPEENSNGTSTEEKKENGSSPAPASEESNGAPAAASNGSATPDNGDTGGGTTTDEDSQPATSAPAPTAAEPAPAAEAAAAETPSEAPSEAATNGTSHKGENGNSAPAEAKTNGTTEEESSSSTISSAVTAEAENDTNDSTKENKDASAVAATASPASVPTKRPLSEPEVAAAGDAASSEEPAEKKLKPAAEEETAAAPAAAAAAAAAPAPVDASA